MDVCLSKAGSFSLEDDSYSSYSDASVNQEELVTNVSDLVFEQKYIHRLNNEINYAKSSVLAIRKKAMQINDYTEKQNKINHDLDVQARSAHQRHALLMSESSKKIQMQHEVEKQLEDDEYNIQYSNIMKLKSHIDLNKAKTNKSSKHLQCDSKSEKLEKLNMYKLKLEAEQKLREKEILKKISNEKNYLKLLSLKQVKQTNEICQATTAFKLNQDGYIEATNKIKQQSNKSSSLKTEIISDQLIKSICNNDEDYLSNIISSGPQDFITNLKPLTSNDVGNVNMAVPEFEGLWDKKSKKLDPTVATKITANDTMPQKIIAYSLEDENCKSFICKPSKIEFHNFEVGQTYCKKISLTNVSSSLNKCKLEGISPILKDVIKINYQAKGMLSAGIKCYMQIFFNPKEDVDIDGEIYLSTQTGKMAISVICRKKKIQVSVDIRCVDFGQLVFGDKSTKYITLKNTGAIPAKFTITKKKYPTVSNLNFNNNASRPVSKNEMNNNLVKNKDEIMHSDDVNDKIKDAGNNDLNLESCGENIIEKIFIDTDEYMSDMFKDFYLEEISFDHVPPFTSVKFGIIWQPKLVGHSKSEFIIGFQDETIEDIVVNTYGEAVECSLSMNRNFIDLQICAFNRLYQDSIVIQNSSRRSYMCKFEICRELSEHLEILPKTFEIRGGQNINAQLKFLPRKSLLTDAPHCFDHGTGVLDSQISVSIQGQTVPLTLSLQAVVTSVDISLSTNCLNFDTCSIHESVKRNFTLINHSILPQKFAFLNVPQSIDIFPGEGFGTLLPNETLEFSFLYKPIKEESLRVNVKCKTLYNSEAVVQCQGVSFRPPIFINPSAVLKFPPTAIGDSSTLDINLGLDGSFNAKNKNESWLFEFKVPDHVPIQFLPAVGKLFSQQKKCSVSVMFTPSLDDFEIRKEAVRLLLERIEREKIEEERTKLELDKELMEKDAKTKISKKSPTPKVLEVETDEPISTPPPPSINNIIYGSKEYMDGKNSLLRRYASTLNTHRVQCSVANMNATGEITQIPEYTMFVELHCPAIKPELVVVSKEGNTKIDFGSVLLGERQTDVITIQNISERPVHLNSSLLGESFELVNALRCLQPNSFYNITLSFTPTQLIKYREVYNVHGNCTRLKLVLSGFAVENSISTSIEDNMVDCGYIKAGGLKRTSFNITNKSDVNINFEILFNDDTNMYELDQTSCNVTKSGRPAFSISPQRGLLEAGQTQEIATLFEVDQPGQFSMNCSLKINNRIEVTKFVLKGRAFKTNVYLLNENCSLPNVYSMSYTPPQIFPYISFQLYFESYKENNIFKKVEQKILVGCLASTANVNVKSSAKTGSKNSICEWSFENYLELEKYGFTINPYKGTTEPESEKEIIITWNPTNNYLVNKRVYIAANCLVKGEENLSYFILLNAHIIE